MSFPFCVFVSLFATDAALLTLSGEGKVNEYIATVWVGVCVKRSTLGRSHCLAGYLLCVYIHTDCWLFAFCKDMFTITRRISLVGKFHRFASTFKGFDLFTPSEQHAQLRTMVRSFCESEVIPQAIEWNRKEEFNVDLFRKLGDLGLLGITVAEEYGGSGVTLIALSLRDV